MNFLGCQQTYQLRRNTYEFKYNGNYKRHWYPREWIDLNFAKVLDDAKRRDKRRNFTLQNNQAT